MLVKEKTAAFAFRAIHSFCHIYHKLQFRTSCIKVIFYLLPFPLLSLFASLPFRQLHFFTSQHFLTSHYAFQSSWTLWEARYPASLSPSCQYLDVSKYQYCHVSFVCLFERPASHVMLAGCLFYTSIVKNHACTEWAKSPYTPAREGCCILLKVGKFQT